MIPLKQKVSSMLLSSPTLSVDFYPKIEEFKKELEKEYGAINVNVETGEYTEIEKEPELSKV